MGDIQILVIDDEPGIREAIVRALKNYKVSLSYLEDEYTVSVDTADSAEAGLEMIRNKSYQVLLLDNQLPGMNGEELLQLLHESGNDADMVTIMITAYASIETAINATRNGAYDFVTKPFTPKELRDSIFKAVKHQVLKSTAQKLVAEKKRIRFEFISVLSHELKSPIAAVTNYLKLMDKKIYGDDLSAYDEMINRSLIRINDMEKLIYDLLDLTRIESGEKKRSPARISLSAIFDESLKQFASEIEKNNLSVEKNYSSLDIVADPTEIAIIANNLISNAIKYNRQGGVITVGLAEEENRVTIRVRDTGVGIDQSDIGKLFKEFSRIRNEDTMDISGSGIGLSTVKKIVSLYDGTVSAISQPGEGTEFIIVL